MCGLCAGSTFTCSCRVRCCTCRCTTPQRLFRPGLTRGAPWHFGRGAATTRYFTCHPSVWSHCLGHRWSIYVELSSPWFSDRSMRRRPHRDIVVVVNPSPRTGAICMLLFCDWTVWVKQPRDLCVDKAYFLVSHCCVSSLFVFWLLLQVSHEHFARTLEALQPDLYQALCDCDTDTCATSRRIRKSYDNSKALLDQCVRNHQDSQVTYHRAYSFFPNSPNFSPFFQFVNCLALKGQPSPYQSVKV